ncbi:MAG: lamin tail domain-containing protein [Patescibacteria group bacterium]
MKYKKMKVIWLAIFSLTAIICFSAVKATTTDIIINEIGAFEPSDHEWIEIFNRGEDPADLSGWKFFEGGVNHGLSLFQGENLVLASGKYAIIAQNANNFALDYPDFSGLVIDSAWSVLNSDGEQIELRVSSSASSTAESFMYLASPDFSLERKDPWLNDYTSLNWQPHLSSSTPGMVNSNFISSSTPTTTDPFNTSTPPFATTTPPLATSTPPVATSTPCACPVATCPAAASALQASAILETSLKVTINEFTSDPLTGAKEWIELYNTNNVPVDLTSWKIFDGVGKIAELGGTIPSNGFLVFELSSSKLNNSGDGIVLKDKNGNIMDSVSYGGWDDGNIEDNAAIPDKGGSVGRKVDGLDLDNDKNDFALSLVPTKSQPNLAMVVEEADEEEIVSDPVEAVVEKNAVIANDLPETKIEIKKTTAVNDDKATVQGIVSVLPGVLGAQIFYVTDPCFQVYSFRKEFPDLRVGDEISVTGTWSEIQGERRLKISLKEDIKILKKKSFGPEEIAVTEAEQYPSCLVKVSGEVMEKKNSSIYLDDGFSEIEVFAKSSAGIKISEIKEGNWLTVTGIVSTASGKIRILPRSQEDMVVGAVKGETASPTPLISISTSTEIETPVKKYWWLVIPPISGILGYFLWKKYGKRSSPEEDKN